MGIFSKNCRILFPVNMSPKVKMYVTTGCSKSHCAKVFAYCSAPGHPICKISSGMFQKSSSFEEYTTVCEIGVHFFE